MTADDVKREHPEAARVAHEFRAVFGDGVKLTYAENFTTGSVLGRPILQPDNWSLPIKSARLGHQTGH